MKLTDFKLNYKEGFKILHLTDIQLLDSTQSRFDDRLSDEKKARWTIKKVNEIVFDCMDALVKKVNPDLILIEGDNVYGEFDDSGKSLDLLMNKLSSYRIPFTLTYGNHDNECKKGRSYQDNVIKDTKYCMFKEQVNTIGLYDNDKLVRTIIMLDTNGCTNASEQSLKDGCNPIAGIYENQLDILQKYLSRVNNVPSIVCQHIVPSDIVKRWIADGKITEPFTKPYEGKENESGKLLEQPCVFFGEELPLLKNLRADNVYYGHDHINNLMTTVDGIRCVYVTKTGTYDYSNEELNGGTISVITNNGKTITNEHIFFKDITKRSVK